MIVIFLKPANKAFGLKNQDLKFWNKLFFPNLAHLCRRVRPFLKIPITDNFSEPDLLESAGSVRLRYNITKYNHVGGSLYSLL